LHAACNSDNDRHPAHIPQEAAGSSHTQKLTERLEFTGGRLETKITQHLTATLPTKLDPDALAAARAEGAAMTTDEAVALAFSLS